MEEIGGEGVAGDAAIHSTPSLGAIDESQEVYLAEAKERVEAARRKVEKAEESLEAAHANLHDSEKALADLEEGVN